MSARRVLWILVFFGFAVNYMIRININIAIVGMVKHPRRRGGQGTDECLPRGQDQDQDQDASLANLSSSSSTPGVPGILTNISNVVRLPIMPMEEDVSFRRASTDRLPMS